MTPISVMLIVPDAEKAMDGFMARAVAAGAKVRSEVRGHEVPWGTHRQGGFTDPFGHNWSVGDISPLAQR
jgi:PhnB protein